ncbi:MAG: hypothetical protein AAF509_14640 [Pseudomonadota bacterium]
MNAIVGALNLRTLQRVSPHESELRTLRQLSAFYLSYGRIDTADKLLRVVLWLCPEDKEALRLQARVYALSGNPIKAADILLRVTRAKPGSIALADWKAVALAFIRTGQSKAARKILMRK